MVKKRKRGGNIPSDEAPVKRAGRPISGDEHKNFEKLCSWLDSETETYSVSELHQKMVEIAEGTDVYTSNKYLKQLLLKRYGNELFFSEMPGLSDVVCFKELGYFSNQ